jgi:glycosyltransferase involved in cell wall biosynthesis
MIDHGTSGLLATTGSASSFAAHLETLIDNPALRREYGQAARRTVEERFRDSDVAEQTSALYRAEVARFTQQA